MASRFVPVPNLEDIVGRMESFVPELKRIGKSIEADAVRFAPKRQTLPEGRERHYADMFDTQAWVDDDGIAVATVNNRHFTALFIEFGTSDTPAFAPLRRALDAATGGRL